MLTIIYKHPDGRMEGYEFANQSPTMEEVVRANENCQMWEKVEASRKSISEERHPYSIKNTLYDVLPQPTTRDPRFIGSCEYNRTYGTR